VDFCNFDSNLRDTGASLHAGTPSHAGDFNERIRAVFDVCLRDVPSDLQFRSIIFTFPSISVSFGESGLPHDIEKSDSMTSVFRTLRRSLTVQRCSLLLVMELQRYHCRIGCHGRIADRRIIYGMQDPRGLNKVQGFHRYIGRSILSVTDFCFGLICFWFRLTLYPTFFLVKKYVKVSCMQGSSTQVFSQDWNFGISDTLE